MSDKTTQDTAPPDVDRPRRPRSLGRSLIFAADAARELCNARLAPHGLTLPQWVVLSALWQRDGLPVSEIAAYTGNAGPATSRILDRMEERDLVARRPDPFDRRAQRVVLRPRGEALRALDRFHEEITAALLDGMDAEEAEALFRLLDRVTRTAEAATAQAGER